MKQFNVNKSQSMKSSENLNKICQNNDSKRIRNRSIENNSSNLIFPLKRENNFSSSSVVPSEKKISNLSIRKTNTNNNNNFYRSNDIFNFEKANLDDNNIRDSEVIYSPRYPPPQNLEENNFYESEITNSTNSTKYQFSPNIVNYLDYQNPYNYYFPFAKTHEKTQMLNLHLYKSKPLNSVRRNIFSNENDWVPKNNFLINENNKYINNNVNNNYNKNDNNNDNDNYINNNDNDNDIFINNLNDNHENDYINDNDRNNLILKIT